MTDTPSRALSFAMEFAMKAKDNVVFSMGIGSELHPMIIGFDSDDQPFGFAQLRKSETTIAGNMQRIAAAGSLMRSGWHCDSLAVIAEGYVAKREPTEEFDAEQTFAQRFADNDKQVSECIIIAWASEYGECEIAMIPYAIGLGRKIQWDLEDLFTVQNGKDFGQYPKMLRIIVEDVEKIPCIPSMPFELYVLAIANEIASLGFYVECDGSDIDTDWINDDNG
jgi:hypothetical protein